MAGTLFLAWSGRGAMPVNTSREVYDEGNGLGTKRRVTFERSDLVGARDAAVLLSMKECQKLTERRSCTKRATRRQEISKII